ncbi:membrane bound O-acyltransferase, MBOAT protein (macronuclear) [Tetrahymena thermophila SB210]|uniref:O-acyltransferase n=1 Tax=Tetrahymena thermophila (strain SB210) TaxID=312017 RepID=Q22E53_TETTS|nr:membrane bound O-acyltransferase, MBOAT protein [Tetrahymena thermophila SB210]EAR83561.1 membrane bound O-acyltransferase, MBOAT protein [Tetrahymena thermophila SB210]|eukprot:XP_001031224.1 membrane bound O-acyltransferase, MBOAT protein [Tetrahymena thermophila SB210]
MSSSKLSAKQHSKSEAIQENGKAHHKEDNLTKKDVDEGIKSSDSETTSSLKREFFQLRPSLLDELEENSEIRKSKFRGVFMALYLLIFTFLLSKPIQNFIKNGYAFSPVLFNSFKNDFFLCIITWPLFYAWSYTAFILQKLILLGLNDKLASILQHSTQSAIFVYTIYMTFTRDWCSTHATFCCLLACSHFMKMHSYTQANKKYREIYLRSQKQSIIKKKVSGNKEFSDEDKKAVNSSNDQQKQKGQTNGKNSISQNVEDSDNEDKKKDIPYPQNINIKNFTLFMWMPVLIYEKSYPRSPKVRIWYILLKSTITAFCILAAYAIWTDYVMPVIQLGHTIHRIELIFQLLLPLGAFNMCLFYILFENILGVFAEITRFGDRKFFDDWWNCTSYEEYNRKWNRPVHLFLYRHVYLECLEEYKTSKFTAQLVTFFFSALLHEWIAVMVFRIVRPILFGFMLFQIPLFFMMKPFKGQALGNAIFWFGLFMGPTLIAVGYLRSDEYVTHYFSYQWYTQNDL